MDLLNSFKTDNNDSILSIICFYDHIKIFKYLLNNYNKQILIKSLKEYDNNNNYPILIY